MEKVLGFRGMVNDSMGSTMLGTIFAVFFRLQEPNDDVRLPGCMYYDGRFGVLYTKRELCVMSDKVGNALAMKNHKNIM